MKPALSLAWLATAACAAAQSVTDPHITTWLTARSAQYARVYETTADKTAGNAVDTWPRSGLSNSGGGQATAAYADIQRVAYSANYVYVYTTGLASYTMGNWLNPSGNVFMFWPTNRAAIHRIPRNPTIPTTKVASHGVGGVWVNGVYLWENGDAQSYTTSTGQVSFNGQGIWNRLAGVAEAFNFDSGNGHQPNSGAYHTHINPIALRYQLGDSVSYDATTKTYHEATATKHSPILGWALDGLPVYGPYGYSSALDPASGIRRMTSGFQKRDGSNGSTNLTATGRTTLPAWAATVKGTATTLPATEYGPTVGTAYPLGTFAEDYEYLGNLGKTQGKDFDLDAQNARYCVTPEYPNGTWAYFVSIDASGNTVFPDVINQQFEGTPEQGQGTVTSIAEAVTDYDLAGPAAAITVTAAGSGTGVALHWNSAEGATYKIESSADGAQWSTESDAVLSAGTATTYTTATASNYYRVTLTAIATYDTGGTYGTPVGKAGTVQYQTATGTNGGGSTTPVPARVINMAVRAPVGGAAGSPIIGFALNGSTTGGKRLILRAVGPTLTNFGLTGALADPSLQLWSGQTLIAQNDNWLAADASVFSSVGAFPLNAGSADAAIVATVGPGTYSTPVASANGASGVAMVECYDAAPSDTGHSLINASARAWTGTGDNVLIPGFVVDGTGMVKLLVRAIGPQLAAYGVTGAVADPQIVVYSAGAVVAANDNWSDNANAADIQAAANAVGAFALPAGSKDAAVLISVPAGSYSAVVSGVGSTTGTALVEVYVVP